ncbi:TetR/AcrR family transcriptional regulator [Actinomadura algeriensis]|uniref:AcrR family transcriptional regulator n=1 Tax=Actinomadura algeriensis TaxID=1679523 RepID=A0ABR9K0G7_9ACTN|nr:TetR/AcrR family transcriptional regulator [Actinomadura algeriensis]MBE1536318.1 AcrR family transcriptional regulator [Actinomadura algeriensis]
MTRSTVPRDHVRARILDAAASVLAEHGERAGMTDIARAAGVTAATLHRHFPDREALLRSLYETAFADLGERLAAARLDTVPTEEAIARMTRATIAAISRYRALGLLDQGPEDARRVDPRLVAPLREVFERGAADGSLRRDLPVHTLAELYFSLLEGVVPRVVRHRMGVEEAGTAVTALFLTGALARPTP